MHLILVFLSRIWSIIYLHRRLQLCIYQNINYYWVMTRWSDPLRSETEDTDVSQKRFMSNLWAVLVFSWTLMNTDDDPVTHSSQINEDEPLSPEESTTIHNNYIINAIALKMLSTMFYVCFSRIISNITCHLLAVIQKWTKATEDQF